MNDTSIVMVLKVEKPIFMALLKPISLSLWLYKVVFKILVGFDLVWLNLLVQFKLFQEDKL